MRPTSRLAALLLGLTLAGGPLQAQAPPVYYFTLTIDNTAGGLGLATATWSGQRTTVPPSFADCAARLETAEVRYRFDGTGPTATEGVLLEPLEALSSGVTGPSAGRYEWWLALRLIRTTATSATLKGSCWSWS